MVTRVSIAVVGEWVFKMRFTAPEKLATAGDAEWATALARFLAKHAKVAGI
jgi:hypothetical protein